MKHVVFIVKENRTFDQVFGARPRVNGDASLAELGGRVSPNHQALADRFTLFNNFYCDSDQSNTGHRWVVGVYPNEWVEVNARSRIEARLFSTAPGRHYVARGRDRYRRTQRGGARSGNTSRAGVSFHNSASEPLPASLEQQMFKETGIRMASASAAEAALRSHVASLSDVQHGIRINTESRVPAKNSRAVGEAAAVSAPTMVLPQDHLTEPHPADGRRPFRESTWRTAPALGRMQTLSHVPLVADMLVTSRKTIRKAVTDHVDAHGGF